MPEPEIQTIATRIAYQNPWMTVREDRIVRASGAIGLYGVVEKPDFALVVPVQDGRMHLVQQYRYPVGERFWEFPQGSTTGGEVDRQAQAATELREETGFTAAEWRYAGNLFAAYGYTKQGFDVYLATQLTPGPTELESEEEGLISRDFSIDEVERMILDGVIRDGSTVAAFGLLRMKGWI
ncbi:ADP-ribose pyrophosphatase [Rhodoferax koreense]|uniref:ADP-ribose pyrophosphatase n=1 Tax=Rhodoferax koreensis TaxID=1842727 RepID=A0A1P8JVE4_9BURK|nr:NUDIX hydrolase [Rhodoferax koreense]APW37727.1 ADP-ribose pyrophosphatase [Rhodoferax koreense]